MADICHTDLVRTTLDLDDSLVSALLARHPGVSKTAAIELAVRSYLAESAVSRLRELAGTVEISDVSADLRRVDRTT
jgi:hypothetical protein